MKQQLTGTSRLLITLTLLMAAGSGVANSTEEFSDLKVIIEINATDGDVGFHVLLDAPAWQRVSITDPDGKKIFKAQAMGPLKEQGLTENFFESAEPLCNPEEAEGERVVTLGEFLDRFEDGQYKFRGKTIDGEKLKGTTELTYNIPAAPVITSFNELQLVWEPGDGLGECEFDDLLADDGSGDEAIPHPGDVEIVAWEAVVEPDIDDGRVLSVQLPPGATMLSIPMEYSSYLESLPAGTEIKGEIGAVEESGNQTFTELVGFCRAEGEGTGFEDCPDDEEEE